MHERVQRFASKPMLQHIQLIMGGGQSKAVSMEQQLEANQVALFTKHTKKAQQKSKELRQALDKQQHQLEGTVKQREALAATRAKVDAAYDAKNSKLSKSAEDQQHKLQELTSQLQQAEADEVKVKEEASRQGLRVVATGNNTYDIRG